MEEDDLLKEIFTKYKNIAVYGMSKNQTKPSHSVPAYLHSKGYTIIPVNPTADEILGLKSYSGLMDVEETIDVVEVFRPSEQIPDVVKEAIERKKGRGDIAVIWLQDGIYHDEAKKLAEQAGIIVIQDRCMYRDHKRFF
jgi:predicted CoA-binding protein